jgi:thiamine pyrophosphokinase
MRAVVFVNGFIQDYAALRPWLHDGDHLVAADGGTRHALALGVHPHVIVGDLDSVDAATVAELEAQGTRLERHPRGKDATDLELAMERAIRDGATEIIVVGALGGRLDQTLANVLILAQRVWPALILLVEGDQVATLIRGGEMLQLGGAPGTTVSLLPLTPEVTGITYRGLLYPLTDATLWLGSTRGISNEVAEQPATIRIASGLALVVQVLASTEVLPAAQ